LRETPSIIQEGAFYLALGDTKLNPIELVDVAKVGFLLLHDGGHQGTLLHMTGPEALTMTEMADRISGAVGKTVRYVAASPNQRRQALIANGVPPQIADALDGQVEERLKGGVESPAIQRQTYNILSVRAEERGGVRCGCGNGFEVGAKVTLFHGPERPRFRQSRDTGASK
jgi:uncharacterized protein YbjT (DUF2867 family)